MLFGLLWYESAFIIIWLTGQLLLQFFAVEDGSACAPFEALFTQSNFFAALCIIFAIFRLFCDIIADM